MFDPKDGGLAGVGFLMTDAAPPEIHRIRLQGPWEWAVPTSVSTQTWTWNRIRLPNEWGQLPFIPEVVWFRRRFNAPTGITPTDRIRVAITTLQQPTTVMLNGQRQSEINSGSPGEKSVVRWDITPALAERNLLEIVFASGIRPSDIDGGMGRPVVLEIESVPN